MNKAFLCLSAVLLLANLSAEEKLKELVGHTLPQVLVGALLGILIGIGNAFLMYYVIL